MKKEKKGFLVKVSRTFKGIANIVDIFIQLAYIGYLCICLFVFKQNIILNYAFLGISGLYLIYHFITIRRWMKNTKSAHRKFAKKIVKIFKKLFRIAIIIVAVCEAKTPESIDYLQLSWAILLFIGFIIGVIFDLIGLYFKRQLAKLKVKVSEKVVVAKENVSQGLVKTKENVSEGFTKTKEGIAKGTVKFKDEVTTEFKAISENVNTGFEFAKKNVSEGGQKLKEGTKKTFLKAKDGISNIIGKLKKKEEVPQIEGASNNEEELAKEELVKE